MKKTGVFCFIIVLFTASTFAQEKPFRIGLKFGVPNIVSLNLEYATPTLNAKLAPTLDLSYFSLSCWDAKVNLSYFELGINYYFMKAGKGLYGHLSHSRIGFKGSYNDLILGDGVGKLGINLLNVKLGAKWGNAFYFKPEIGFNVLIGSSTVKVEYTAPITNYKITEEKYIPGFLGGGIVFNIGFGVAF